MFDYIRDPNLITQTSFARIRQLVNVDQYSPLEQEVALRLIHTCGEPGIIDHLAMSADAVAVGVEKINHKVMLLCDVEMLLHGLSHPLLKDQARCFLNAPDVAQRAKQNGETRTMTALEHWRAHMEQAIVAIGNAPTALFRLLEMVEEGAPKPALIVGMPVGFVGAQESKQALVEVAKKHQIPYITLLGQRGGSALAATCLNAMAMLSH